MTLTRLLEKGNKAVIDLASIEDDILEKAKEYIKDDTDYYLLDDLFVQYSFDTGFELNDRITGKTLFYISELEEYLSKDKSFKYKLSVLLNE